MLDCCLVVSVEDQPSLTEAVMSVRTVLAKAVRSGPKKSRPPVRTGPT